MVKIKKDIIVTNLLLMSALFVACQSLYGDVRSVLDRVRYFNVPIKEITYSYYEVTVLTGSETLHIHPWLPLVIAAVGIVLNLLYLLINYQRGK